MTSGCDSFQELMLDLAYDELEADRADRLREHAAGCAGCRAELESILLTRKLAAQLPEPEPPTTHDAEILALAVEAASRHAGSSHPDLREDAIPQRRPAPVERPVPLIDRLRGLLLRPALVTAGVAGVVFVISYFIGSNLAEPDGLGQSAESAAPFIGPAVPMDSTVEEAQPRPLEPLARASASAPEGDEARHEATSRDLAPAERLGTGGAPGDAARGGSLGTAGPVPQNSAAQLSPEPPALAAKAAPAAQAFDEAEPADLDDMLAGAGAFGGEAEDKAKAAGPLPAPMPKAEEQQTPAGDDARFYREGMDAYDRGDCATATIALRKVVDPPHDAPSLVPSALHHVARCEKRTGRCGKAVVAYDELLGRFPSYQGRAEALWEAAACHRRLGHIDRARALLDELARIPSWRDRAKTEQQNLEQLQDQE